MEHPGEPIEKSRRPAMASVFISAKSADYGHARQVFQFLKSRGICVFLSDESLPELGSSDYRKEIDRALDQADHMVVVASSRGHLESAWVEAEWGFFINEKRSGRKAGNLVTVVTGGLQPRDMPPSLRYYEALPLRPDALERLLRYVGAKPVPGARATVTDRDAPAASADGESGTPAGADRRPSEEVSSPSARGDVLATGPGSSESGGAASAAAVAEPAEVVLLRKAAEYGDAVAQVNLGLRYQNGDGVTGDAAEAVKWYRKAAAQESALGQNNLGTCYWGGIGVAMDEAEGLRWFRKAAEKGEAYGQLNVACAYWDGLGGVKKDEAEAIRWYQRAALQGNAIAQRILGEIYLNGTGVTEDKKEAARLFREAADRGDAKALRLLDDLVRDGSTTM